MMEIDTYKEYIYVPYMHVNEVIGFSTVARTPKTSVQHVIAVRKMHALIFLLPPSAVSSSAPFFFLCVRYIPPGLCVYLCAERR